MTNKVKDKRFLNNVISNLKTYINVKRGPQNSSKETNFAKRFVNTDISIFHLLDILENIKNYCDNDKKSIFMGREQKALFEAFQKLKEFIKIQNLVINNGDYKTTNCEKILEKEENKDIAKIYFLGIQLYKK